jgi:hypothetical protein
MIMIMMSTIEELSDQAGSYMALFLVMYPEVHLG